MRAGTYACVDHPNEALHSPAEMEKLAGKQFCDLIQQVCGQGSASHDGLDDDARCPYRMPRALRTTQQLEHLVLQRMHGHPIHALF